jgi:predicted anti-sigma-YlaC factor YlaD
MPSESDQPQTHRLTCKEVSVALSQAQDRDVGLIERLQLEAHLKLCEGCRNFQRQLDFLRRALRRHPAIRSDGEEE